MCAAGGGDGAAQRSASMVKEKVAVFSSIQSASDSFQSSPVESSLAFHVTSTDRFTTQPTRPQDLSFVRSFVSQPVCNASHAVQFHFVSRFLLTLTLPLSNSHAFPPPAVWSADSPSLHPPTPPSNATRARTEQNKVWLCEISRSVSLSAQHNTTQQRHHTRTHAASIRRVYGS